MSTLVEGMELPAQREASGGGARVESVKFIPASEMRRAPNHCFALNIDNYDFYIKVYAGPYMGILGWLKLLPHYNIENTGIWLYYYQNHG